MPLILITLIAGLVVATAALVYAWKNPHKTRPATDGTPLFVLGIVFLGAGVGSIAAGQDFAYGWVPVGIVFLAVGARQRRRHRAQH